jgi:hypothetical protein
MHNDGHNDRRNDHRNERAPLYLDQERTYEKQEQGGARRASRPSSWMGLWYCV